MFNVKSLLAVAGLALICLPNTASADHLWGIIAYRGIGTGEFGPVNAGTIAPFGNAGTVLGDRSGITPYHADNRLGTSSLGPVTHEGSIQTYGQGILNNEGGIVWPGVILRFKRDHHFALQTIPVLVVC